MKSLFLKNSLAVHTSNARFCGKFGSLITPCMFLDLIIRSWYDVFYQSSEYPECLGSVFMGYKFMCSIEQISITWLATRSSLAGGIDDFLFYDSSSLILFCWNNFWYPVYKLFFVSPPSRRDGLLFQVHAFCFIRLKNIDTLNHCHAKSRKSAKKGNKEKKGEKEERPISTWMGHLFETL